MRFIQRISQYLHNNFTFYLLYNLFLEFLFENNRKLFRNLKFFLMKSKENFHKKFKVDKYYED